MAEWITSLDYTILAWIQENLRIEWLTPLVRLITSLGNAGIFWIILSVVLLFFKRTRKAGALALVSLLICFLVTNVWLKNMVARMRPYERYEDIILLVAKAVDYSFPSGHTASSFAAAGVYWRYLNKKAGIGLMILAAGIGLSRLYVGIHYPSDVLVGWIVGFACSQIVYYGERALRKYECGGTLLK